MPTTTTIRELKALASQANVRMSYNRTILKWEIWHPSTWWFRFDGQIRTEKNKARFFLLGVIFHLNKEK